MNNISIKGNKNGLIVSILSGNFDEIKTELVERLERGKDFFSGSDIRLVDADKKLEESNLEELKNLLKERYSMTVEYCKTAVEKEEKVFTGIYEGKTRFIKNTVRSGQRIIYPGNVVVIGDVNSGAEVIAAGNIVVLGVLRGIAHAGYSGNKKAVVAAYRLQPAQLRIADIMGRSPDNIEEKPFVPETAKVREDRIIIEPYLPNKYI